MMEWIWILIPLAALSIPIVAVLTRAFTAWLEHRREMEQLRLNADQEREERDRQLLGLGGTSGEVAAMLEVLEARLAKLEGRLDALTGQPPAQLRPPTQAAPTTPAETDRPPADQTTLTQQA